MRTNKEVMRCFNKVHGSKFGKKTTGWLFLSCYMGVNFFLLSYHIYLNVSVLTHLRFD